MYRSRNKATFSAVALQAQEQRRSHHDYRKNQFPTAAAGIQPQDISLGEARAGVSSSACGMRSADACLYRLEDLWNTKLSAWAAFHSPRRKKPVKSLGACCVVHMADAVIEAQTGI
jgi:hypothetical protein